MIDVSEIHLVQVVSQLGSISKAAEQLHLSQPTLSKRISRLEQKLKMALFYRDTGGMVPTEAAKLLTSKGHQLTSQIAQLERELALMANLHGGMISVGVGPIVEQDILPKVLLDFVEHEYNFKISTVTMSSEALLENLQTGKLDIAVGTFGEEDVPSNFLAPLKYSNRFVGVVRSGHELSTRTKVHLNELMAYKNISPSIPKNLSFKASLLMKDRDFSPRIACESYDIAKRVVLNSDYVTSGPEILFRNEFINGQLVKLELESDLVWECRCLVKPEHSLAPAIQEIIALFAQYMTPT